MLTWSVFCFCDHLAAQLRGSLSIVVSACGNELPSYIRSARFSDLVCEISVHRTGGFGDSYVERLANAGCWDNAGTNSEMSADRRSGSSCRIIDAITESLINDVAVIGSGNALTFSVSSDTSHSDESV